MTTASRAKEAEEASVAFQIALTQIGVKTVEEALKLWAEVPVTARASTSSSWLKKAITMVMTRRRLSRDLARAYYRLARALRTGTTVADPYHPEPSYVTLDSLRREFASLAGGSEQPQEGRSESAPTKETEPASQPAQTPETDGPDAPADEGSEDAEADRILVEELERLKEDEERIEREAEAELREVLQNLGPNNLAKKQRDIDPEAPAKDVDRLRDEAHAQAGARQAAAAERIAMNGGRSTVWNHAQRDRRALGYIRLSRTGTPCGWCAMLISRGPVYRSQSSAEGGGAASNYGDGDKYHDNCHCYAEPVFSLQQYRNSPTYALNRQYEELWPQVTKGLGGDAAISAWRRFIRTEQRAAAQEARRSTTSVQEA
ncbi:head maturation protease [Streptomyces phage Vanseggelen]|uniref:Head maturation protease n=1 Tax=Streptomyces phage Vanseggelen TaxID=3065246 RepID=A0AA50F1D1_9CAUD|nr:head maturation protease [Streptomyces phage Vanseggelen]